MKPNFYGGDILDILAIVVVAAAVLMLPIMYLIRYLVIEKKANK